MERILYFINEISIDRIVEELEEDPKNEIVERRGREVHLHRTQTDREANGDFIIIFSKTLSESLLKLRKRYFNCVVIDERMNNGTSVRPDFQKHLVPFIEKIDSESDIDKRYSLSRIIVLLDETQYLTEIVFELGKLQIGAYITRPFIDGRLLNLISDILHHKRKRGKKALCIAGGGVEGLLYELGVLRALNSLFKNYKVTDFDIFCGISSGAYISALLANNVQPEEFILAFEGESTEFEQITPHIIYDLNLPGYLSRLLNFWKNIADIRGGKHTIFSNIIKAFPNGICKGERLREFLRKQLTKDRRTDDFRQLEKELYIGATNMDTFEHVVFGSEGWRDVPISTAVRASSAMEPIYSPARIGSTWYIDGAFTRTTNFELAIKRGSNLVIIIDPIVPIKTEKSGYVIKKGGIFSTLQGVKGLISTRFDRGYSFARKQYPDVDFHVFRPRGEDMKLLSGSPMKYTIRLGIIALAYETTINRVLDNFDIYSKGFAKHGIELTRHVVKGEEEQLKKGGINAIRTILENAKNDRSPSPLRDMTPSNSEDTDAIDQFISGVFE